MRVLERRAACCYAARESSQKNLSVLCEARPRDTRRFMGARLFGRVNSELRSTRTLQWSMNHEVITV